MLRPYAMLKRAIPLKPSFKPFVESKVPAMKPIDKPASTSSLSASTNFLELIAYIGSEWRRQRSPLWLFLALCLNLAIAPTVLAASEGSLSRTTAYAIGLLGLVTLGLSVYLFVVIFQPERF